MELPGYRIIGQIHEGSNTIVYRALREKDNFPVIIKTHRSEYPSTSTAVRRRSTSSCLPTNG